MDSIVILDFGSQYTQLIARRIREAQVYCELFPFDTPAEQALALNPAGFILSGGPESAYVPGAPQIPSYALESGRPILGICYGMQALTHALGGVVAPASKREYGRAEIETVLRNPLISAGHQSVWMSHGDRIDVPPEDFQILAHSANSPVAAMGDLSRHYYGLQFHPEVSHTPGGARILRDFAVEICGARQDWTPQSIIETTIDRVREQVGNERAIAAVSGGVDSSVAAALVHRAIGGQLTCVFVNSGLLRLGEPEAIALTFGEIVGAQFVAHDATEAFLEVLQGISDPEEKRRLIGERFIRIFEEQARLHGAATFLVQGTIYPDVVESRGPERQMAERIKTHHNVGGLPQDMEFGLIEPLRYLFKDEVRQVGLALGLPEELVWRQPFPGPGLAVRCLGNVNLDRLNRLRRADKIVTDELKSAGLLRSVTAQAFAVLLPVRSVGVMGDQRTYGETVAIRAVTTEDFMTADWAPLPSEVLALISTRIVNEVDGVNRVVYDITSKPPATIEWE